MTRTRKNTPDQISRKIALFKTAREKGFDNTDEYLEYRNREDAQKFANMINELNLVEKLVFEDSQPTCSPKSDLGMGLIKGKKFIYKTSAQGMKYVNNIMFSPEEFSFYFEVIK